MTTKKLIQAVVVQWQRIFVTGRLLEFPLLLWRRGPGRGGRFYRNLSFTMVLLSLAFVLFRPGPVWAQDDAATKTGQTNEQTAEATETVTNSTDSTSTNETIDWSWRRGRIHRNALVSIGHDVELKEGETAEAVVVIGGSAIIRGKVRDAAVAIGGNLDIEGEV